MRRHHINFLLKFHKPTSRHLYLLHRDEISASSDFAKPTNVDKLEEQLRESLETFKQKKVN